MKPRSIAIALAFCVSLVSTSYAQQIPKSRVDPLGGTLLLLNLTSKLQRFAAVSKQLHLTRSQEKQLIAILKAQQPELQAIRNDQSLSRVEKLQRLRAVHDESNPQVKAILTPQQYQQLQVNRQQRRAQLMAAVKAQTQGGAARLK